MPRKSKKEAASEYVEELLKHVPEAQRESVRSSLTVDAALDHLGEHVLMRSEADRLVSEAKTKAEEAEKVRGEALAYREQLNGWWEGVLKQTVAKKPNGDTPPADDADGVKTPVPVDLSKYITKEEAAALAAAQRDTAASEMLRAASYLSKLQAQHQLTYREVLDTDALIAAAQKEKKPLDAAYQEFTREMREKREQALQTEKEAKLRAEIEKDVRSKLGHGAYPTPTSEPIGTLAGLATQKPENQQFGVRAAVEEWNQRVAEKAASGDYY